tara:strand:- start:862 stop:1104 length:243 start_codon:yes stop_codon:yes gene_type:complete
MFNDLKSKTELLESLDWDEEALIQLLDFISCQNELFIPTHPSILLDQIEEFFGKNTRLVMEKLFDEEVKLIVKSKESYEN